MLPARSDDSQPAGWFTLSASQVPEIEAIAAGVVVALVDESRQVGGVLLSPTDYHELLLSAARSLRAVAEARLREGEERDEGSDIKKPAVKKIRISQVLKAAISQLERGGRITVANQIGAPQGVLLDLAEYELLRAAEALQMRAPMYRRMLEEGEDAWQRRETIKW